MSLYIVFFFFFFFFAVDRLDQIMLSDLAKHIFTSILNIYETSVCVSWESLFFFFLILVLQIRLYRKACVSLYY